MPRRTSGSSRGIGAPDCSSMLKKAALEICKFMHIACWTDLLSPSFSLPFSFWFSFSFSLSLSLSLSLLSCILCISFRSYHLSVVLPFYRCIYLSADYVRLLIHHLLIYLINRRIYRSLFNVSIFLICLSSLSAYIVLSFLSIYPPICLALCLSINLSVSMNI